MNEDMKQHGMIDAEAFHKALEGVEKALDQVHSKMAESLVTIFVNDWRTALDRISSEEKLYSHENDDADLDFCCYEELEKIESTWEASFAGDNAADEAVAHINRQIRAYIYELASVCGYNGNYIENALVSIAKKCEVSRIKAFVDGLEMEKDE